MKMQNFNSAYSRAALPGLSNFQTAWIFQAPSVPASQRHFPTIWRLLRHFRFENGTSGSKKGVKEGLRQYGQDKLFKLVLTNIFSLKKKIIVTVMPIFREKKAKIQDFDARGVWRRCILRKVSIKWSIPHYSLRAWKYEANGALVEGVSAIFAEKNESSV